jgi:hypothetical protein
LQWTLTVITQIKLLYTFSRTLVLPATLVDFDLWQHFQTTSRAVAIPDRCKQQPVEASYISHKFYHKFRNILIQKSPYDSRHTTSDVTAASLQCTTQIWFKFNALQLVLMHFSVAPRNTHISVTFSGSVENSSKAAAGAAVFKCASDGNPLPTYEWMNVETGHNWTGTEYVFDLCDTDVYRLPIAEAGSRHNVTMMCTSHNAFGTDAVVTSLTFNATHCQQADVRGNGCCR